MLPVWKEFSLLKRLQIKPPSTCARGEEDGPSIPQRMHGSFREVESICQLAKFTCRAFRSEYLWRAGSV